MSDYWLSWILFFSLNAGDPMRNCQANTTLLFVAPLVFKIDDNFRLVIFGAIGLVQVYDRLVTNPQNLELVPVPNPLQKKDLNPVPNPFLEKDFNPNPIQIPFLKK
jgi:hypothetical protein